MNKLNVGFVILHYLTEEETIKSVNSIRKNIDLEKEEYKIVIVDNDSKNNSFEVLKKLYENNDDIVLIKNTENLGFARGNNVGMKYLTDNYDIEFVCCLNNDVYLLEKDLYKKLKEEYEENSFAVLGPLILSGDGRYDSNPQRVAQPLNTKSAVEKSIKRAERMVKINKYHLDKLYKWYRYVKFSKKGSTSIATVEKEENVQLSGACLFFSKKYFEKFEGFYPETFLYKEEDILAYLLKAENLTSIFAPNILVFHKEDAATDVVLTNERRKNIFVFTEYIKSLKVLLRLIEEKGE